MPDGPVGFIGLGVMGRPMALNLVRAGHRLVVHTRSTVRAAPLRDAGALVVGSPRAVAAECDLVITMLPDSPDVEEVYLGADGLLAAVRPGALLIDMSSVAPATARRVATEAAARGADALDAPVSGGDVGAAQGTLSIMVGGSEAAYHRALPLLEVLGTTIVHVGDAGAGQVTKACNQVLVALVIEAVSEALVLGGKAGVAPERLLEVLKGGLAGNRVMEVRGRNLLEHDFTPGFRVDLHRKDLRIALGLADDLDVALPVTAEVARMLDALHAAGRGDADHSALLTVLEERANHRI